MKISILVLIAMAFMLFSCGESETTKATDDNENSKPEKEEVYDPMKDKGVGPVTSITLGDEIDFEMAKKGEEVFTQMCTACHKADKKFIGPAPKGILEKRTPEWIMNMILNPEKMIVENEEAKKLLIEYNMAPMANQNLTEEQARAILEYYRTL